MGDHLHQSIGLSELIQQVKQELLSKTPEKVQNSPIFFVNSVDIEVQVTVKREGKAGVKIDVVSVVGGELGGGFSRDDVHKVKVTLSPLFSQERLTELYEALNPNQVNTSAKHSVDALFKGEKDSLADQF